MERKQRIEITDLIELAVENAIARRNEALNSEDALSSLSDEEATNVAGGTSKVVVPVLAGFKPVCPPIKPPIIVGLIAIDPKSNIS